MSSDPFAPPVTVPLATRVRELPTLETWLADRPLARDCLLGTLVRAEARQVEHVHVEPTGGDWRLRWRHDDMLEECSLAGDDALPAALALLVTSATRTRNAGRAPDAGSRTIFTARLDGVRHVVTLVARRVVHGDTYVLTLHGRLFAPPGLDALVDDPSRLRLLRTLVRRPAGWLPVASASLLDGERLVRALAQELASPDRKLLCLEPSPHPPLAGVAQLRTAPDAASLLALDPDAVVLAASPSDGTLVGLAAQAIENLLVVHRTGARRPSEVMRRLLALGLAPAWLALAVPAIVVRHRLVLLCPHCRRPDPKARDEARRLGTLRQPRMGDVSAWLERSLAPRFEAGDGCAACTPLGHAGIRHLTDVVLLTEDVREALLRGDLDGAMRRIDVGGDLGARLTALVDAGTISATEAARHLAPRF